jgi:hypothetical protein
VRPAKKGKPELRPLVHYLPLLAESIADCDGETRRAAATNRHCWAAARMPIELGISTGSNELTPAQFRRLREEFEASQRTDSAATGSASRGGRATSPQSAVSDDEFHEAGGVGLVAESAERLLADSLESEADADFHEADSGMPEVAAAAAAAPAISAVAPQRSGWGSWLWGVRSSSRSSLTSQDTDSAFS